MLVIKIFQSDGGLEPGRRVWVAESGMGGENKETMATATVSSEGWQHPLLDNHLLRGGIDSVHTDATTKTRRPRLRPRPTLAVSTAYTIAIAFAFAIICAIERRDELPNPNSEAKRQDRWLKNHKRRSDGDEMTSSSNQQQQQSQSTTATYDQQTARSGLGVLTHREARLPGPGPVPVSGSISATIVCTSPGIPITMSTRSCASDSTPAACKTTSTTQAWPPVPATPKRRRNEDIIQHRRHRYRHHSHSAFTRTRDEHGHETQMSARKDSAKPPTLQMGYEMGNKGYWWWKGSRVQRCGEVKAQYIYFYVPYIYL
ncbi:hypothetical protein BD410DRAFT_798593 [Rickenella mellea]|uniref:Uncharacterized protein n=1 Tax=Rickenella mellea TaxID=50990 RepID=A0A4R5XGC7_9AGAM|nr:hypothetical protein BD410DRAFT_798593 [Rickenella mellea]